MSNLLEDDSAGMELGVEKLLGFKKYDSKMPEVPHEHESDGYEYDNTPVYVTYRCHICGVHYDVKK